MKAQVIIQDNHSGTTIHNVTRNVSNINRDQFGNETGTVKIKGSSYTVTRKNGQSTFYG